MDVYLTLLSYLVLSYYVQVGEGLVQEDGYIVGFLKDFGIYIIINEL